MMMSTFGFSVWFVNINGINGKGIKRTGGWMPNNYSNISVHWRGTVSIEHISHPFMFLTDYSKHTNAGGVECMPTSAVKRI